MTTSAVVSTTTAESNPNDNGAQVSIEVIDHSSPTPTPTPIETPVPTPTPVPVPVPTLPDTAAVQFSATSSRSGQALLIALLLIGAVSVSVIVAGPKRWPRTFRPAGRLPDTLWSTSRGTNQRARETR